MRQLELFLSLEPNSTVSPQKILDWFRFLLLLPQNSRAAPVMGWAATPACGALLRQVRPSIVACPVDPFPAAEQLLHTSISELVLQVHFGEQINLFLYLTVVKSYDL